MCAGMIPLDQGTHHEAHQYSSVLFLLFGQIEHEELDEGAVLDLKEGAMEDHQPLFEE